MVRAAALGLPASRLDHSTSLVIASRGCIDGESLREANMARRTAVLESLGPKTAVMTARYERCLRTISACVTRLTWNYCKGGDTSAGSTSHDDLVLFSIGPVDTMERTDRCR
jgi:hypothetical protein